MGRPAFAQLVALLPTVLDDTKVVSVERLVYRGGASNPEEFCDEATQDASWSFEEGVPQACESYACVQFASADADAWRNSDVSYGMLCAYVGMACAW